MTRITLSLGGRQQEGSNPHNCESLKVVDFTTLVTKRSGTELLCINLKVKDLDLTCKRSKVGMIQPRPDDVSRTFTQPEMLESSVRV